MREHRGKRSAWCWRGVHDACGCDGTVCGCDCHDPQIRAEMEAERDGRHVSEVIRRAEPSEVIGG